MTALWQKREELLRSTDPARADERAELRLKIRGYDIQGGGLYWSDEDHRFFVAESGGVSPVEVYDLLKAGDWPTRFGEIPCVECDAFQDLLGGLCHFCIRHGAAVDS